MGNILANEAAGDDLAIVVATMERAGDSFLSGLHTRLARLSRLPEELSSLRFSMDSLSVSPWLLFVQIVAVTLLVALAFFFLSRYFANTARWTAVPSLLSVVAPAVATLFVGWMVSWLISARSPLVFQILRLWATVAVFACIAVWAIRLLIPRTGISRHRALQLDQFARDLSVAIVWAILGTALGTTLKLLNAGPGIYDLARTAVVGIPAYALFFIAVRRHNLTIASIIAGERPRTWLRARVARAWPTVVIGLLTFTILSTQAALTMGVPLPGTAVVLTDLIFIATPHLDAMMQRWAQRGLEMRTVHIMGTAARQTCRFAGFIVTLSLLGILWSAPLAFAVGLDLRSLTHDAIGIGLIALIASFLWNVVGTLTARAMFNDSKALGISRDAAGTPRSRLGTIVPLLSGTGKTAISALAFLSILVTLGFNVWPLITGLSVFGLAVGFGCQAIVKDVVSGPFFLIDDAFRFGEHIETSGARGTVEKISIRSVSIRRPQGSIVTIPYGAIGTIENFSRDWVVEKLSFRVPFDTDVEFVQDLLEKIGEDIGADPRLSADLLQPFTSTGISGVEDGTLVIRAEFTAKPGRQSAIRRAALKAVQTAFRANGILAVPKLPVS